VRLFFALWPPHEAAEALHRWALAAQRDCGGRAVPAGNIHLTLAFLGEVAENPVIRIQGHRHSLPIEQARYWAHSRIVWVGPREIPGLLLSVAENLKNELESKGFKSEKRPFAAHITLIRKAREPGTLPPLPAIDWPVTELVLVESRLAAAGPRYEVLRRYPLG
jgi:2'-5' RNA ligase